MQILFGAYMLMALLWIGISLMIGLVLLKVMRKQSFSVYPRITVVATFLYSVALYLRFGLTVIGVQGMILFFLLLYASCSDLTSHTMDDYVWVMVCILALLSVERVGVWSMVIGASMVFVPQILIALLPPHKSLGGADIKLSTALACLLGWGKGLAALIFGLILAVIVMAVVQKLNHKKKHPFALIPFLSIGAIVMFMI